MHGNFVTLLGDLHTGLSFITWALVCGYGKNVKRSRDALGAWYPLPPKLVTFGLGTEANQPTRKRSLPSSVEPR